MDKKPLTYLVITEIIKLSILLLHISGQKVKGHHLDFGSLLCWEIEPKYDQFSVKGFSFCLELKSKTQVKLEADMKSVK